MVQVFYFQIGKTKGNKVKGFKMKGWGQNHPLPLQFKYKYIFFL